MRLISVVHQPLASLKVSGEKLAALKIFFFNGLTLKCNWLYRVNATEFHLYQFCFLIRRYQSLFAVSLTNKRHWFRMKLYSGDLHQMAKLFYLPKCSWASASQFWGFPFTFQLVLSARNLRSSWGRPKAAWFSEIYVACIILFILWLCRESHDTVCSTKHISNMQQTVKQNVFIQTLHLQLKTQFFCRPTYLAWTLLIWSRHSLQHALFP